MEKQRYPTDVVFSGVRVSNLFAYSNFNFEDFISFDRVRAFDYWHMLLHLPICFLN
jgi:hypothetical protein